MIKFVQVFKRKALRGILSGQKYFFRNLDETTRVNATNSALNNLSLYSICAKLQADIVKALSCFIQVSLSVRRNTDDTVLFNYS